MKYINKLVLLLIFVYSFTVIFVSAQSVISSQPIQGYPDAFRISVRDGFLPDTQSGLSTFNDWVINRAGGNTNKWVETSPEWLGLYNSYASAQASASGKLNLSPSDFLVNMVNNRWGLDSSISASAVERYSTAYKKYFSEFLPAWQRALGVPVTSLTEVFSGLVAMQGGATTGGSSGQNTNSQSSGFQVGSRVTVTADAGVSLNVRSAPSTTATILGTQPVGASGVILGGPTSANGYTWWNIDYDNGADGWSVSNYLSANTGATASVTQEQVITSSSSNSGVLSPNVKLSADKSTVVSGQSVQLTWSSGGASYCLGNWGSSLKSTTGNETVSVKNTTVFTLLCTNQSGVSSKASVTVSTGSTASSVGVTATAGYSALNASTGSSGGNSGGLQGGTATTPPSTGAVVVGDPLPNLFPLTNVKADIKVNGSDGPVNAKTATLSWIVTNAGGSDCTITVTGTNGGMRYQRQPAQGSFAITGVGIMTYTLNCQGAGGSATDQVVVVFDNSTTAGGVGQTSGGVDLKAKSPSILNPSDGPITLMNSENVTLSWDVYGLPSGGSCTLTNPLGANISVNPSGTLTYDSKSPNYPAGVLSQYGSGAIYTLTCSGTTGVYAQDSVRVYNSQGVTTPIQPQNPITPPPSGTAPTVNLDISGTMGSKASGGKLNLQYGEGIILKWSSTNAIDCTMGAPFNSTFTPNVPSAYVQSGYIYSAANLFAPTSMGTTYSMTCVGSTGLKGTDSITAYGGGSPSTNPPPFGLVLDTNTYTPGGAKPILTWYGKFNEGYSCAATNDGGDTSWVWNSVVAGQYYPSNYWAASQEMSPAKTTTYTMSCTGPNGFNVAKSVIINVAGSSSGGNNPTSNPSTNPQTPGSGTSTALDLKINGSDGPLSVAAGTTLNLAWTYTGASTCAIVSSPSGPLNGMSINSSGSYVINGLVSSTYTLTCGGVSDSVAVNVYVVDPNPNLPSTGKFSIGDKVRTTANLNIRASSGTSASLVTTAFTGTNATITAGPVSANGYNWYELTLASGLGGWGIEDYLEKVSSGSTVSLTLSANPSTVSSGSQSVITWSAPSATTCYGLGATNFTYPASGSITVTPTQTVKYSLTCYKGSGSPSESDTKEITITVGTGGGTNSNLSAPTLTSAVTSSYCGGYVDLKWTAVSGATAYKIFRNGSATPSFTTPFPVLIGWMDGPLTPSMVYQYTIKATDGTNDSPASNQRGAAASASCN